MTNQEFLNSLSDNAKNIIKNYQCKTNKIDVEVFLDDKSYVETNIENKYIIHVNQHNPFNQMEYEFVHEFYHCIQKDEGFPNISYKDIKYQKLAAYLTSVVLDLDVINRMNNIGYSYDDSTLDEKVKTIIKLIKLSSLDIEVRNEIHELFQYNKLCLSIAFCRILYSNQYKINYILQLAENNTPYIYKTQSIIYNTITKIGYDTPRKTYKIFKTLIRELKLSDYVTISPHQ